jgi:hypothetical protein
VEPAPPSCFSADLGDASSSSVIHVRKAWALDGSRESVLIRERVHYRSMKGPIAINGSNEIQDNLGMGSRPWVESEGYNRQPVVRQPQRLPQDCRCSLCEERMDQTAPSVRIRVPDSEAAGKKTTRCKTNHNARVRQHGRHVPHWTVLPG